MNKHPMPPEDLLSTEASTPQKPDPQADMHVSSLDVEKPIKKANKGLILTILTAFIVTSVLLGYIFFLQLTGTKNLVTAQNLAALIKIPVPKSTPYPDQSPSPSPMISDWQTVKGEISSFEVPQDWKSFKDSINGVSFRYPNNWFLNTSKLNKDRSVLYLNDHEFVVPEDTEFNAAFEVSFNTIPAYSYPTSEDLFYDYFEKSLEDLIERYKRSNFKSAVFVQDLVIDNHKANQVYGFHGPGMLEGKYFRKTFIQLDNRVLIFAHNESDHKQIYDQVLSTFKFTNKNDNIEDWKTYTNDKFSYQVKYPQNLSRINCEGEQELFYLVSSDASDPVPDHLDPQNCARDSRFNLEIITTDKPPFVDDRYQASVKDYAFAGLSAQKTTFTRKPEAEGPGENWFIEINFNKNGLYYQAYTHNKELEGTLDLILTTFKFTN